MERSHHLRIPISDTQFQTHAFRTGTILQHQFPNMYNTISDLKLFARDHNIWASTAKCQYQTPRSSRDYNSKSRALKIPYQTPRFSRGERNSNTSSQTFKIRTFRVRLQHPGYNIADTISDSMLFSRLRHKVTSIKNTISDPALFVRDDDAWLRA